MTDTVRTARAPGRGGWPLFYPVAIVIAAGVVMLSLGPAPFAPRGAPAQAVAGAGAMALGPAALSRASPDAHHVVFVVRGAAGAPSALRIAIRPGAPEPYPTDGVTLALAPDTARALADKPLTLRITLSQIVDSPAESLAIRLLAASPQPWAVAELRDAVDPTFDLPAAAGVTGIALRAIGKPGALNAGVEITSISIATP